MSAEAIKDAVHEGVVDMYFAHRDVTEAATLLNYNAVEGLERDRENALNRARQAETKLTELRELTERVSELQGWGIGAGRIAEERAVEASGLIESARGKTQGTQDGLTQILDSERAQSYTAESIERIKAASGAMSVRNELVARYTDEFAAVKFQSQGLNARLAAIGGELAGLIEKIGSIGKNPNGSIPQGEHQTTTAALNDAASATAASHQGLSALYQSYRRL